MPYPAPSSIVLDIREAGFESVDQGQPVTSVVNQAPGAENFNVGTNRPTRVLGPRGVWALEHYTRNFQTDFTSQTSSAIMGGTSGCIAMAFHLHQAQNNQWALSQFQDSTGDFSGVQFRPDGRPGFDLSIGGTRNIMQGNTPLTEDGFYTVIWTSSGASYQCYLNGVSDIDPTPVSGTDDGMWFGDGMVANRTQINGIERFPDLETDLAMYAIVAWDDVNFDQTDIDQIHAEMVSLYGYDQLHTAKTMANAVSPLTTPTYDGSGETTHPGVWNFGAGNVWPLPDVGNSRQYWMAHTPYPANNSTFENPSISYSADGQTWSDPTGLTNPLQPYPGPPNWHADAELVYDEANDRLVVYYIDTGSGTTRIMRQQSSDGVTWEAAAEVLSAADFMIASPCVRWDGTQWLMWYADATAVGCNNDFNRLWKRTSADGITWGPAVQCGMTPGLTLWHMHIFWYLNQWIMTAACHPSTSCGETSLYFAHSEDGAVGERWNLSRLPLVSPGAASAWDEKQIYRTSAEVVGADLILRYAGVDNTPANHIGYTADVLTDIWPGAPAGVFTGQDSTHVHTSDNMSMVPPVPPGTFTGDASTHSHTSTQMSMSGPSELVLAEETLTLYGVRV